MSEAEEIKKCLECKKVECTNCMRVKEHNPNRGKKYPFNGEMRTVAEIADILGMTRQALDKRISVGGFEYAVSGVCWYKTWLKQKGVRCE